MAPTKRSGDPSKPRRRWGSAALRAKKEILWKVHMTRYLHRAQKIQAQILSEFRLARRYHEKILPEILRELCLIRGFQEQPRSMVNHVASSSSSRSYQLQFEPDLPEVMYSLSLLEIDEPHGLLPIKVLLLDESMNIVKDYPLSSFKVEIVPVRSDFMVEKMKDWTEEDFNRNIVHVNRDGVPLLRGKSEITLRDGVGVVEGLKFASNSSSLLNNKVRLAARVAKGVTVNARVKEAVSGEIWVKDGRGRPNQKHRVPSLDDDVSVLEKIGRNGKHRERLVDHGIIKVKDFLRCYHSNQPLLRSILGVSGKIWESVTRHAQLCVLSSDSYKYHSEEKDIELLFNCVYQLIGVSFKGEGYQSPESLDKCLMDEVEMLKIQALQNPYQLNKVDSLPDHLASNEARNQLASTVLIKELVNPAIDQDTDQRGSNLSFYSYPHRQHEKEFLGPRTGTHISAEYDHFYATDPPDSNLPFYSQIPPPEPNPCQAETSELVEPNAVHNGVEHHYISAADQQGANSPIYSPNPFLEPYFLHNSSLSPLVNQFSSIIMQNQLDSSCINAAIRSPPRWSCIDISPTWTSPGSDMALFSGVIDELSSTVISPRSGKTRWATVRSAFPWMTLSNKKRARFQLRSSVEKNSVATASMKHPRVNPV